MMIAAVVKTSFVDYPGKIAAVVFTPGCNLNCFYCHNRGLLATDSRSDGVAPEEVFRWLGERQGLLDAVVITGGEPTLQPGLAGFIAELRAMGYLVKLDTNGTRPTVLASLIDAGLLDYAAMDIKAPSVKYEMLCGVPVDPDTIDASIDLLLSGRIDYEFRTTVVPQLTKADILAIGQRICDARSYVLQQYRRPELVARPCDPRLHETPHPLSWLRGVLRALEGLVQDCRTRGPWSTPPDKTERTGLLLPR